MQGLSLFMTELITSDNTRILLPNGSVWGRAIINHSTYPGTGRGEGIVPGPRGATDRADRPATSQTSARGLPDRGTACA
ncbi:hypothetical protein [Bradyrhizobium erythrophlei]|uniref:hypothetical protein n=1 Tax=Bradyrhizobium erythrophlei TaxID=1437360 RepID=UPI001FCCCB0C|nr:hypothetical protein [Bradyrhizobium erythrophlei]